MYWERWSQDMRGRGRRRRRRRSRRELGIVLMICRPAIEMWPAYRWAVNLNDSENNNLAYACTPTIFATELISRIYELNKVLAWMIELSSWTGLLFRELCCRALSFDVYQFGLSTVVMAPNQSYWFLRANSVQVSLSLLSWQISNTTRLTCESQRWWTGRIQT